MHLKTNIGAPMKKLIFSAGHMNKRLLIALILLTVFCGEGWGATYYVSYSLGSDANNGTSIDTPWKYHPDSYALSSGTSAAKRETFQAGDVIYMRCGDSWPATTLASVMMQPGGGVNGTEDSPIHTTCDCTLFGDGTQNLPIIKNATVYSETWTTTGTNNEYSIACTTHPYIVYNGDTQMIEGTVNTLPDNGWAWSDSTLTVRLPNGVDPTGGNVEAGYGSAIYQNGANYRKYSKIHFQYGTNTNAVGRTYNSIGTTFEACLFSRGASTSFYDLGSTTNSTYTSNTFIGGGLETTAFMITNSVNPTIQYNTFSGYAYSPAAKNGAVLIKIQGTTYGGDVSRNSATTPYGNQPGLATAIQGSAGIYILGTAHNNNIHHNDMRYMYNGRAHTGDDYAYGYGLLVSGGAYENDFYSNYFYKCYQSIGDFVTSGAGGNKYYHNISEKSLTNSFAVWSAPASEYVVPVFSNNTILHSPDRDAIGIDYFGGHAMGSRDTSAGCVFVNNTIILLPYYNSSGVQVTGELGQYLYITHSSGYSPVITLNNNLYYDASLGSATEQWVLPNNAVGLGDGTGIISYTSEAAYKARMDEITYFTINSQEVDSIFGLDPRFISATDFHLKGSSPCINAGADVWTGTASVTDYAGTAITNGSGVLVAPGSGPDIGAYEWNLEPLLMGAYYGH
jgi:hypothetical protein